MRLKELRRERGLTQLELAEKAGLSRGIITRLESDKDFETTTGSLLKLARALEVPVDELFSADSA